MSSQNFKFFKNILRRALACCATPTPGGGFDPRQAGAGEVFYFSQNKKSLTCKIKLDKFQL
jgi:hypothetical protein